MNGVFPEGVLPMKKKIGIVVNPQKSNARKWLGELRTWLEKRSVLVQDTLESSMEDVLREASLLVCLGGD